MEGLVRFMSLSPGLTLPRAVLLHHRFPSILDRLVTSEIPLSLKLFPDAPRRPDPYS